MSFSDLIGKTLIKIDGAVVGGDVITFITAEGNDEHDNDYYYMQHHQSCCESVYIKSVEGDILDLLGTPITMAEESSRKDDGEDEYGDSSTWTFYRLASVRGYVTITWLGTSNGYYSESVEFEKR